MKYYSYLILKKTFKSIKAVLAGVAHLVGCHPAKRKVVSLIPSQAHAWVAGQSPAGVRVRSSPSMFLLHIDVSLPLFLPPLLLSKSK